MPRRSPAPLVVAAALTLVVIATRRDVAYAAVLVWALAGIVIKQAATPLVARTAGLMAALVAVAGLVGYPIIKPFHRYRHCPL